MLGRQWLGIGWAPWREGGRGGGGYLPFQCIPPPTPPAAPPFLFFLRRAIRCPSAATSAGAASEPFGSTAAPSPQRTGPGRQRLLTVPLALPALERFLGQPLVIRRTTP